MAIAGRSYPIRPWIGRRTRFVAGLALDGTPVQANGTTNSLALPGLTTTSSPDIIIVAVETNGGPVTSITDTAGLTYARRTAPNTSNPAFTIEEWYAVSSGVLSNDVITINTTSSAFVSGVAFGVSGADTSTIWDSNASIPQPAPGPGSGNPVVISTNNANDFLIGAFRFGGTANPTAGAGWTQIFGGQFMLVEYKIVSATQSSLSIPVGTGTGNQNAALGDAIIQASTVTTVALTARLGAQAKLFLTAPTLAAALAARLGVQTKLRITPSPTTTLAARLTAKSDLRATSSFTANLVARLTAQGKAVATTPQLIAALAGRLAGQAKAYAAFTAGGAVNLVGRLTGQAKALANPRGVVGLAGRVASQATGRAALTLRVALAARLTAQAAARAVITASTPIVFLQGALAFLAKGRATPTSRLSLRARLTSGLFARLLPTPAPTGNPALYARTVVSAGLSSRTLVQPTTTSKTSIL